MNWNKWVRQTHRWLSIAFTVAVIVNGVAVALKSYTVWMGLLALLPLALLLITGVYLFVLPYATNWRSGRRTDAAVALNLEGKSKPKPRRARSSRAD